VSFEKFLFASVFFSCSSLSHPSSIASLRFAFDPCRERRAAGISNQKRRKKKEREREKKNTTQRRLKHTSCLLNLLHIMVLIKKQKSTEARGLTLLILLGCELDFTVSFYISR